MCQGESQELTRITSCHNSPSCYVLLNLTLQMKKWKLRAVGVFPLSHTAVINGGPIIWTQVDLAWKPVPAGGGIWRYVCYHGGWGRGVTTAVGFFLFSNILTEKESTLLSCLSNQSWLLNSERHWSFRHQCYSNERVQNKWSRYLGLKRKRKPQASPTIAAIPKR